jgi:polysaccharide pyruvyl transferase WcaK-like protein
VRSAAAERGAPLRIALNLNFDIENPANWETFQRLLAETLKLLAEERPLEIHTLPMQSHFKAMHDALVLEEFRARIPELDVIIHLVEDHREAAAVIAQCDLLLAERLHALVMAAILGKPFYALMYDVKVRELVDGLGMSAHAVDINHPFDPAHLAAGIEAVLANAEPIGCHLQQRSSALRQDLAVYFATLEQRLAWKAH